MVDLPSISPNAGRAGDAREDRPGAPPLSELVAFSTNSVFTKKGGEWVTNCPFPSHEDKNPSFSINNEKANGIGLYCCSCQLGGNGYQFAMSFTGKNHTALVEDYNLAVERGEWVPSASATQRGAVIPSTVRTGPPRSAQLDSVGNVEYKAHPIMEEPYDIWKKMEIGDVIADTTRLCVKALSEPDLVNKDAISYLETRDLWPPDPRFKVGYFTTFSVSPLVMGFDKQAIVDAGIAYKNDNGLLRYGLEGRITFPWCDEHGTPRGITGRAIGPVAKGHAKYKNSRNTEIFSKSDYLWGLHLAKNAIKETGQLLAVEGYTDVMTAHKVGMTNVVSAIGVSISYNQLREMFRLCEKPIIILDGDKVGQSSNLYVARRALQVMREFGSDKASGKTLCFALLSGGKDPDDIIREQGVNKFREMIANPLSIEQLIDHFEERIVLKNLQPDQTSYWDTLLSGKSLDHVIQNQQQLLAQFRRANGIGAKQAEGSQEPFYKAIDLMVRRLTAVIDQKNLNDREAKGVSVAQADRSLGTRKRPAPDDEDDHTSKRRDLAVIDRSRDRSRG